MTFDAQHVYDAQNTEDYVLDIVTWTTSASKSRQQCHTKIAILRDIKHLPRLHPRRGPEQSVGRLYIKSNGSMARLPCAINSYQASFHAYLPSSRSANGRIDGDFTTALPTRLGSSALLDSTAMALSATYIGQAYQDLGLRTYSLQKYVEAVKAIRTQLARLVSREDVLYVTAILQTYEVGTLTTARSTFCNDNTVIDIYSLPQWTSRLGSSCAGL